MLGNHARAGLRPENSLGIDFASPGARMNRYLTSSAMEAVRTLTMIRRIPKVLCLLPLLLALSVLGWGLVPHGSCLSEFLGTQACCSVPSPAGTCCTCCDHHATGHEADHGQSGEPETESSSSTCLSIPDSSLLPAAKVDHEMVKLVDLAAVALVDVCAVSIASAELDLQSSAGSRSTPGRLVLQYSCVLRC